MEIVAICVCTHQRPGMLTRCLRSLAELNRHSYWKFVFIIVDNETLPNNRTIVNEFERTVNYTVKYVHQPRRGISVARNAALEMALEQKADWICFFDDDQYVDKNAVVAAYLVAQDTRAQIVFMRLFYLVQDKLIQNMVNPTVNFGQGGGCLLDTSLIKSSGLALRFDEEFGLGGGEDGAFFSLARSLGVTSANAHNAIVYEERVMAKTTHKMQLYAAYCGAADAYKLNTRTGHINFQLPWTIFRKLTSIIEIPFLLLYFFISPALFYSRSYKIAYRFSQACGYIAGILKLNPEYYKKTQGY